MAVLEPLHELKSDDGVFVFPKMGGDGFVSEAALRNLMGRMSAGEWTIHGFRSTLRDWAGEATNFPRDVAEMALAHRVGDETERAYRRGDTLEKRRTLMQAWADYCNAKANGNVVPLLGRA
jgi:integrase